ncbi:MAG TPA: hypothetical protein DF613_03175 [Lachnospiraceae bacterium]|nr:hypothetical protein [Lachnospiraceae bacterium]
MYLSMWILADALKHYEKDLHIQSGKTCIRNASLLAQRNRVKPHTVYLMRSGDYIPTMQEGIICTNRDDYIILHTDSFEDAFDRVQEIIDDYMEWDMHVLEEIAAGCSLRHVLHTALPFFNCPILILDSGQQVVELQGCKKSTWPADTPLPLQPQGSTAPLKHLREWADILKRSFTRRDPFLYENSETGHTLLLQNIFQKGVHKGWMVLLPDNTHPSQGFLQLADVLHGQIEEWWDKNVSDSAQEEQKAAFLNLLTGEISVEPRKLWKYFNRLGWYQEDTKYVIEVDSKQPHTFVTAYLERNLPGCQALFYREMVVLVVNTKQTSLDTAVATLKNILVPFQGGCGVSYPFRDLFDLPIYLEQADIAMNYGIQKGESVSRCENYIISYARKILHEQIRTNLVHPDIVKIREYDKNHGTEYDRTLCAYLLEERNHARTAKRLGIHKNTLIYRTKKLEQEFGISLDDEGLRLRLLLSYILF